MFDTKVLLTMDASILFIHLSDVDITLVMDIEKVTLICW